MKNILLFIFLTCIGLVPNRGFAQAHTDTTTAINVTIKGNDIYNNTTRIAYYKNVLIDSDFTSIVIYNMARNRVAEATHAKGDTSWTIATPVDQNIMHLHWDDSPQNIITVVLYLILKKYL